ncbi:MAG: hypothetical protein KAI26_08755 [Nanoarchaeota archaeon]|nr:hypothetical protein [Nanoarchaeota archaeon]
MKTQVKLKKRLFPILVPTSDEKRAILETNRKIDYCLENNLNFPPSLKNRSVYRLTAMYGPKTCNFKCPDYCCTEGISQGNLSSGQLKEILNQAKSLGVKSSYWPGLGESLLHKEFLNVLEYSHSLGIEPVVFTNGSLFWNNRLCNKSLGISSDELLNKLRDLNVSLYVKYWNSDPKKAAEMTGVSEKEYPYSRINGKSVPLALKKLVQYLPQERIGVETMVSGENYEDVIDNIIPNINDLNIHCYLEPVILSGKAENKMHLLLTAKQTQNLKNLFVSGGKYCQKRQALDLILIGNRMSPGIVIPPKEEDCVIDEDGKVKDLFEIYHNPYFRKVRKIAEQMDGCLCRAVYEKKINIAHY